MCLFMGIYIFYYWYFLYGSYYGYLNILTLFFYKCVCYQTNTNNPVCSFLYGGTIKSHEPGMAQRSQRCGGGPRPYRFNVGTEQ